MRDAVKKITVIGSSELELSLSGSGKGSHLVQLLRKIGWTLNSDLKSEFLLAFDHNHSSFTEWRKTNAHENKRSILIRLEPPAVFPLQYGKKVEESYTKIFTPGALVDFVSHTLGYGWVYRYDQNPINLRQGSLSVFDVLEKNTSKGFGNYEQWVSRPIELSMIAGNKVSPREQRNYKIRRSLAKSFREGEINIYGTLWNERKSVLLKNRMGVLSFAVKSGCIPDPFWIFSDFFRTYNKVNIKGTVNNKHEILENSKFNLAIENSNTYVSEKLFDSIVGGAVPIYVGPELKNYNLPANIAIQCDGSISGIREIVRKTGPEKVTDILQAGQEFLSSDQFKSNWTEEGVYSQICEEILEIFS
jgi:hypothetical protein